MDNVSSLIPPTDDIREQVKKWYLSHKDAYAAFSKQADGVGGMNLTFFIKLMKFASDCIPKDKLDVCSYIFRLGTGDVPSEEETPDFIRKYNKVMEEFLQGGKIITVSAATGEVKCFGPAADFSPEPDVCVISNEEFDWMKTNQPELLRYYLNDLYEEIDEEAGLDDSVRSSEVFFDAAQRMAYVYALILTPRGIKEHG